MNTNFVRNVLVKFIITYKKWLPCIPCRCPARVPAYSALKFYYYFKAQRDPPAVKRPSPVTYIYERMSIYRSSCVDDADCVCRRKI